MNQLSQITPAESTGSEECWWAWAKVHHQIFRSSASQLFELLEIASICLNESLGSQTLANTQICVFTLRAGLPTHHCVKSHFFHIASIQEDLYVIPYIQNYVNFCVCVFHIYMYICAYVHVLMCVHMCILVLIYAYMHVCECAFCLMGVLIASAGISVPSWAVSPSVYSSTG